MSCLCGKCQMFLVFCSQSVVCYGLLSSCLTSDHNGLNFFRVFFAYPFAPYWCFQRKLCLHEVLTQLIFIPGRASPASP